MTPPDTATAVPDIAVTMHPGAGDTVLWIHGYTMDARIWAELWHLLPDWRHIGIDLPGHGRSPPLRPGTGLSALARPIASLARQQQARHLVGLSFGGMIALQVAIEDPDAFDTLVLGAPALAGGPQDRRAQACNLELVRLYNAHGPGPWLRDLWMTSPSEIFNGAARHPALWRRLHEIIGEHRWSELADCRMQKLTTHHQTPAELRRITADTLVLVGENDAEAFRRCAELIRRAVPNCRRVHLADTGHLTLLERAGTVRPLLERHFRRAAKGVAGLAKEERLWR
jgi:2-succinyl-6-hydroxy-2,4-cyclohexadiene-1-carboxylate synthase